MNLEALAAEFQQLKTELGAYGVNMTPGAKAALEAVGQRIAAETTAPRITAADLGEITPQNREVQPTKGKA